MYLWIYYGTNIWNLEAIEVYTNAVMVKSLQNEYHVRMYGEQKDKIFMCIYIIT